MTEIPEHLLKRSRDRRAALGLGGDDAEAGSDKPATTPATTAAAAPAQPAATGPATRAAAPEPVAPEPPKPDSPVVAAYKSRRRVPFWAMAVLSLLPIWALMYARAITESPEELHGALGVGAEVYGSSCASCHGAGGDGGVGYAFTGGDVFETFPHIEDQIRFVYYGTTGYNVAGVTVYGNPDREGGAHITGALGPMPAQGGDLTDYQILGAVCHERYTLGGGDPGGDEADEYEQWCSDGSEIFEDLEGGGSLTDLHERFDDIMAIGDEPVAGSPPSG